MCLSHIPISATGSKNNELGKETVGLCRDVVSKEKQNTTLYLEFQSYEWLLYNILSYIFIGKMKENFLSF